MAAAAAQLVLLEALTEDDGQQRVPNEEPAAEPAPAADLTEFDVQEPVATAVDGRVVIEAASLAAEDCRDSMVPAEDILWKAAAVAGSLLGIGGSIVLRKSPGIGTAMHELQQMRQKMTQVPVKAVLDIEDANLAGMCSHCPIETSATARPTASCFVAAASKSSARSAGCSSHSHGREGAGCCNRGNPFPECALCLKGGSHHKFGPCMACDRGLKIVTKNTFLVMAEDTIDEDGEHVTQGTAKKRSRSA